jgi:RNA polymerase sigma-70 factor, ECF subfamily
MGATPDHGAIRADVHGARLVARAGDGDHEAFDVLYARHARLLNAQAGRILHDWAEAEDVVQEVFVQAWKRAASFDPSRGTPAAWLITMARTRALDRLRRRACRPDLTGDRLPLLTVKPLTELALSVRAALERLRPERRYAIELAYFEGLSQAEIASRLGRPLGTIKTWIRQAILELKRQLSAANDGEPE